jgi:homoserine dehydrogenase
VEGWDARVKVSALGTVLMDYPLKPQDVKREGIRGLTMEQVQSARMTLAPALVAGASAGVGRPDKLVCQAERTPEGAVIGSVRQ